MIMELIKIHVPDKNSSFVRAALDKKIYHIKFDWNEYGKYWTFGVYTSLIEPIVQATKIVPNYPFNLQYIYKELPSGVFFAYTKKDRITREDFKDGLAVFAYIPMKAAET